MEASAAQAHVMPTKGLRRNAFGAPCVITQRVGAGTAAAPSRWNLVTTDHRMSRRRATRLSCLATVVCAILFAPKVARAQVEVTVTDSTGRGLAGARVELWQPSLLLSVRSTDSVGVAGFSAFEVASATEVRVRHIGYAPARASLGEAGGRLNVQLSPLAQSLPSVTIAASVDACPQSDSPEARELWASIATRYREPSFESRFTELDQRIGSVEETEVGQALEGGLRTGSRMYTSAGMEGAHQQIVSHGYASSAPRSHDYDLFGAWQYAQLDAELSGHFATPAFASAHTFAIASQGASVTTLRFCARDRRASGLDGRLQVSEGEGFIAAHWRFWNPARDAEAAGGSATFASTGADSASAPLLSTSGLFWRQLPSGRFLQRWQSFHEWQLVVGSEAYTSTVSLADRCHPPPNYVLCSVTSVDGGDGSTLSHCFSMAYRCFDK